MEIDTSIAYISVIVKKKSQRAGECPVVQHKNPAMQYLVYSKGCMRERRVLVYRKILNACEGEERAADRLAWLGKSDTVCSNRFLLSILSPLSRSNVKL